MKEADRLARKLRKKLRQIEQLECLGRELNEEEREKVAKKDEIRRRLLDIMKRSSEGGDAVGVEAESSSPKRRRSSAASSPNSSRQEDLKKSQQLEVSRSTPTQAQAGDARTANEQAEEPSSSTHEINANAGDDDVVQVKVSTLQQQSKSRRRRQLWKLPRRELSMCRLEPSHQDLSLATDVDAARDVAVTTSRDTTALAWRLSTAEQVASLRGHTAAVSAVVLLPAAANALFGLSVDDDVVAVTGSADCSLKVWDVLRGRQLRSVYTYNGVRCLALLESPGDACLVLSGTDGGKLEVFDLASSSGTAVASVRAHDEAVTAVHALGDRVVSAARDGNLKIWALSGGRRPLRCLFASEDVRPAAEDQAAHARCVLCAKLVRDGDDGTMVVFGDAGCNIKVLDWKRGLLHKLPNHVGEEGFTDSISLVGDSLLVTSFYDLDVGRGGLNFFKLNNSTGENGNCVSQNTGERPVVLPEYLCTWRSDETGRILSLAASSHFGEQQQDEAFLTVITAGRETQLWQCPPAPSLQAGRRLKAEVAALARPSEAMDSGSSDDDDEEEGTEEPRGIAQSQSSQSRNGGWGCAIL